MCRTPGLYCTIAASQSIKGHTLSSPLNVCFWGPLCGWGSFFFFLFKCMWQAQAPSVISLYSSFVFNPLNCTQTLLHKTPDYSQFALNWTRILIWPVQSNTLQIPHSKSVQNGILTIECVVYCIHHVAYYLLTNTKNSLIVHIILSYIFGSIMNHCHMTPLHSMYN